MRFNDLSGSTWKVYRQWIAWKPKVKFNSKIGRGFLFDGSNDLAGLAVGIVIMIALALPAVLELLLNLVASPFVFLFRVIGAVTTTVHVRCVTKLVADNGGGKREFQSDGVHERWSVSTSGFIRAGKLRNALIELVKENGRGSDVEGFAAQYLGHRDI